MSSIIRKRDIYDYDDDDIYDDNEQKGDGMFSKILSKLTSTGAKKLASETIKKLQLQH